MPPFYTANKLDADSSAASIMDLQTVWNRMDQLERLVLTQSKEIDNLKRIVNPARSHDSRLYNNNHHHHQQQQQQHEFYPSQQQQPPDQYRKNYSNERFISSTNPGHRNMQSKFINNGQQSHNGHHSSDKPYNRQTFQPYLMNSFVHPPNAIPPGANRRQLINDDDDNNHHHHYKSNGFERNIRTPPLPVSKRWSAAPNLASNMDASNRSAGHLGESLDDSDELQNHKHGRQTFVEPPSNGSGKNPDPPLPLPPPPAQKKDGVADDRVPQPMVLSDDEEDVDVERLDSSGASEQIIVHQIDGASSALVLAVETTESDHAITRDSDYDSDVQEITVIPPKLKTAEQPSQRQKQRPSNQLAIYQPGAASETNNNSNSGSNHNKSFSGSENRRIRIKTVPKRNTRRHSSDPKSANQSWIWSKDPNSSSSKSSLPPELAQVIKRSPF